MGEFAASTEQDPFVAAGRPAGLAFYGFARWVEREVTSRRIESVYLLSREGPFLDGVIRAAGVALPHMDVLEVSRVSTFLPTVPDFSLETMMRVWERFPRQSPEAMLSSLGLDGSEFVPTLRRSGLAFDEEIFEPWKDDRVLAFLRDPDFAEKATGARDESRSLLSRYLEQKGYAESERVALVDVGWRGTIQDSLARLTPSVHSTGLLLAYRPADLPQYANTAKAGFLAGVSSGGNSHGQELRMAASPLEMLCTCPGGSSVAYEASANDVVPIRRPIEAEEVFLRSEIARFQTSVFETVEALRSGAGAADPTPNRALALAALKSVLFDPDPDMVRTFEAYQLDPSIGGGDTKATVRPGLRALASSQGRHGWKAAIQHHGWPHALVKRSTGARPFALARRIAGRLGDHGRWLV